MILLLADLGMKWKKSKKWYVRLGGKICMILPRIHGKWIEYKVFGPGGYQE